MKKNGFTLVEILAVLVLVSAIIIISVPSIINYINSSKQEISEVTQKLIFAGTDLYIDNNKHLFPEKEGNEYCVTLNDVVESGVLDKPIVDSVSGEEINLNKFVKISYIYDEDLKINKYNYEMSDSCIPSTKICRPAKTEGDDIVTTGNVPTTGEYNYGDEYICNPGDGVERRFFVLEDGDKSGLTKSDGSIHYYDANPGIGTAGSGEVALIMNQNIGNKVAWCSATTNETCNADTARSQLQSQTSNWIVETNLPTYNQVYKVKNYVSFEGSKWLYDNLDNDLIGYWLSTTYTNSKDGAWNVLNQGRIGQEYIGDTYSYGVRPVITISKNNL